jgi:hypothetical protein
VERTKGDSWVKGVEVKENIIWQKRLAKEWLWFISTLCGVLVGWSAITLVFRYDISDYLLIRPEESAIKAFWGGLVEMDKEPVLMLLSPVLIVYIIRMTVWSIKQVRKK